MIVALYLDESKPVRFRDAQTARSSIAIYSCSGKPINRIHVCRLQSCEMLTLTLCLVGAIFYSWYRLVR
jgi:hypothetical protein